MGISATKRCQDFSTIVEKEIMSFALQSQTQRNALNVYKWNQDLKQYWKKVFYTQILNY